MKFTIEEVKDLEDFKTKYYNSVGNTSPDEVEIEVLKPSNEFLNYFRKEAENQFDDYVSMQKLMGNEMDIDVKDVKFSSIWFHNYGRITILD